MKSKAQKRAEAEIRQEEYQKLTLEEQMLRARLQPGNSERVVNKLEKRLKKAKM